MVPQVLLGCHIEAFQSWFYRFYIYLTTFKTLFLTLRSLFSRRIPCNALRAVTSSLPCNPCFTGCVPLPCDPCFHVALCYLPCNPCFTLALLAAIPILQSLLYTPCSLPCNPCFTRHIPYLAIPALQPTLCSTTSSPPHHHRPRRPCD